MPLVDYDSSDEGSEDESKNNLKTEKAQNTKPVVESVKENSKEDGSSTLFSTLPKPRTGFSFLEDSNKLSKLLLNSKDNSPVQKLKRENIKISVPSLSEFEDDKDQPSAKKLKPSVKGVGLFSILPPPKNSAVRDSNKTLVPQVVAKSQMKQNLYVEKYLKQSSGSKSAFMKELDVNEEDNEDVAVGNLFFGSSLSEQSASRGSENISVTSDIHQAPFKLVSDWTEVSTESSLNSGSIAQVEDDSKIPTVQPQLPNSIPAENNPLELDEKALQILCGGKKKRQQMAMNVIDLSGEEIMPDSKEWLLKQFTEEKKVRSHSHRRSDGPSSQSKRKHQITYLAFQAKEQELELQNQWANNRMSRKQTQSKYGF